LCEHQPENRGSWSQKKSSDFRLQEKKQSRFFHEKNKSPFVAKTKSDPLSESISEGAGFWCSHNV
jgi:hypothetical protein